MTVDNNTSESKRFSRFHYTERRREYRLCKIKKFLKVKIVVIKC